MAQSGGLQPSVRTGPEGTPEGPLQHDKDGVSYVLILSKIQKNKFY